MDWENTSPLRHQTQAIENAEELKLLNPKKTKNPTKDGQKRDIIGLPSPKAQRILKKRGIKTRVRGQGGLL